jgi:hypothetical protein
MTMDPERADTSDLESVEDEDDNHRGTTTGKPPNILEMIQNRMKDFSVNVN